MKKIISIFLLLIISIIFMASDRHDKGDNIINPPPKPFILSSIQFNANTINTWYRNNGSYNRNPTTGNQGFEWPKLSKKFCRYASGLWLGAKVGGQIRIAVAEYDYEYLSGEIDPVTHQPHGKDDPNYRIYVITKPSDPDYAVWPVSQGAPLDGSGNPLILGAMTMYYVYTDGYPTAHGNRAGSTLPLGVDIQQTNFAFTLGGPLSNMIFQRFRLINKGADALDSMYVSLWTDDDVGANARGDLVGCDTLRSLGFTYKGVQTDPWYNPPPAVGFDFFQGPLVNSPGDTAIIPILERGTLDTIPNKKVLGMSSFNKYTNGDPNFGDPANYNETFNYMKGRTKNGAFYINPVTGQPTPFVNSGDPELNTGWLDVTPDDRRFMMNTGPFTMNPGDTQDIVTVQLVAQGTSNLNSVTVLKGYSDVAQKIYDNAFLAPSAFPAPTVTGFAPGNGKIYLAWDGAPEKQTVPNKLSGNKYTFEGYIVYYVKPGKTGDKDEDLQELAVYDVVNNKAELRDSVVDNYGVIVWTIVVKGTNSGIKRFIVLDKDPITSAPFINGTPYKFAVVSCSYDTAANIVRGSQKVNKSNVVNAIITVTPQALTQGTVINYGFADTVWSSNRRDAGVVPIVFEPLQLRDGNYRTSYSMFNSQLSWTLTRDNVTIISNNRDFSGTQDTSLVVDGLLLVHQIMRDSGVVKDADDTLQTKKTKFGGWQYNPPQNRWIEGVSPSRISSAKLFTNRQFESKAIGISFPNSNTFRGVATKIKANGTQFTSVNGIINGGPLRKIKMVFGPTQKAYRYAPDNNVLLTDTNLALTPYRNYVDIPFQVFAIDELDSSGGAPRQLNVAFIDPDNDGVWNPDTTGLGKYQIVYIFASSYSANPDPVYTGKNPGIASQFLSLDIMYAWAPKVRSVNGAPMTYQNGDELIIYPYTITRADYVPGYPVYYNFSVTGSIVGSSSIAKNRGEMEKINVFPNPYYGGHRLEPSDFNRFVYFSNLPNVCTIYLYTLNGELIRKIERNNTNPNNSLEPWDLQNSNGVYVASGMYIAYIDAPGIGTKILKLAILTPEERIRRF